MHPDRKIGIAMGILLVGVVAALFFRNEPLDVDDTLSMRRERELNERLRERDVAVYMDAETETGSTGEEGDLHWNLKELYDSLESRDSSVPVPLGVARTPSVNDNARKNQDTLPFRPPVDEFETITDSQTKTGSSSNSGSVTVTKDPALQPNAERSTPAELTSAEPTPASDNPMREVFAGPADEPSGNTADDSVEFQEYTVRFGDTLSGIAERFLGSQNRYRDIYEVNKDRMETPDRLRVGSAIRIPRVIR
ncbi:MAG: LysM peptidoglycan-binding domain-containing protein [Planctomycetaceae bacterium]|nr:LysM peptidoglycan-binding domain-containing protein [Planctomycetaceae bacterium]